MEKIEISIPGNLKSRKAEIERTVNELVFAEEKRRVLSLLLDRMMSGAEQLSDDDLVALGRKLKKGRFSELKKEEIA